MSVPYKNVPGDIIILEPEFTHYNLQITQDTTISINRDSLPTGKDIRFTALFQVEDFLSVQFAQNVHFQDGKTISVKGLYYYTFFYDEVNDQWYAKLDYSIIQHISPGGKYLYVDGKKGNDANSGLSWQTAKQSIQAAIDAADIGDGIMITAGTYYPTTERTPGDPKSRSFIMKNSVHLFGGCLGNEATPSDIPLTSVQQTLKTPSGVMVNSIEIPICETILSGDINQENVFNNAIAHGCRYSNMENNVSRLIHSEVTAATRLKGVVLEKSYFSASGVVYSGSVAYDQYKALQISNTVVRDNVFILHSVNTPPQRLWGIDAVLSNSIVEYMTSGETDYYSKGYLYKADYCIIRKSIGSVTQSSTTDYTVFNNCELTQLFNSRLGQMGYYHMYNSYVHGSNISMAHNGAGSIVIANTLIESCTKLEDDRFYLGGLFSHFSDTLVPSISRTIIRNCDYKTIFHNLQSRSKIENTLIANNKVSEYITKTGETYNNCTIVNNKGTVFAGIKGTAILNNCVVWGNRTGDIDAESNVDISTVSCNYSAIENLLAPGNGNISLSAQNTGNASSPYFAVPSTSAGITAENPDYSITSQSALVDKGENSYLSGENQMYDILTKQRIVNNTIDIGAYEYQVH